MKEIIRKEKGIPEEDGDIKRGRKYQNKEEDM